jgi:ADP-heptose:LPS heptosyltransferase
LLYNAHVHAGQTFIDLVHGLATPAGQVPHVKRPISEERLVAPRLAVDPAITQAVRTKLQAHGVAIDPPPLLVVLNPSASERFPMRELPLPFQAELAKRLIEQTSAYVVLIGVDAATDDARHIRSLVNSPRLIDLTGKTTLLEVLHLFELSRVVITADSGPAHFASLTPAHVVVFFGPETPNRYAPLAESCDVVYAELSCSPCVGPFNQRLSPCNDNLCMQGFDVDAAAELVKSRLESPRQSQGRQARHRLARAG